MNFRIAVKAVIIRNNQLLVIKRRPNDVHKPGQWDLPGGRLEPGEDPWQGIQRETTEEVGLKVEPIIPFDINHFTRDDGQVITMLFFLCRAQEGDIHLSEEHTDYRWAELSDADLPDWMAKVLTNVQKLTLLLQ